MWGKGSCRVSAATNRGMDICIHEITMSDYIFLDHTFLMFIGLGVGFSGEGGLNLKYG